jgi:hypothetical protein
LRASQRSTPSKLGAVLKSGARLVTTECEAGEKMFASSWTHK